MTGAVAHPPEGSRQRRVLAWAIVGAVLAVFVGANAHLVAVSFASQPDCVLRTDPITEGAGVFRAAKPSC